MNVSKKTITIEAIAGIVLLALANYLGWKGNAGFYGINPHPYFIVILLMATRYGSYAGFFSASVSSLALAGFMYFSHKPVLNDYFFVHTSILFFIVGWVTGEISQISINKINNMLGELKREKLRAEKLDEENNLIKKVNKEMERRILDDVSTFANLYETSKQLQSFDLESIYHSILNLLNQYLEAQDCALYLLENDTLVLKESICPTKKPVEKIQIYFNEGIIARSVRDKRVYSVRDVLQRNRGYLLHSEEPLMAAPLVKTNGEIIGAITIEKMPFFNITGSAVKIFALLADWVSADIESALYFHEVKKKNILDEVLNVYTYDYFCHRLDQEFYRAKRYMMPLSVVLLSIQSLDVMPVAKSINMLKFVAGTLNNALRLLDIVTRYSGQIHFGIILTSTNEEQAKLAINRIIAVFKNLGIDTINDGKPLELIYSTGSYSTTMETKEDLLKQIEDNLEKCPGKSLQHV